MPTALASPRAWLGAAALGCISLLVSSPGLLGGFVHDDLNMVGNPHYRDAEDVWQVALRHSGAYAPGVDRDERHGARDSAQTQTYRPLTMLTLVATHVLSPTPLAHHLVGWMLHALCGFLLWLALRRSDPRSEALWPHTILAALFLLHPVGVESYVWINGRSDLMAGLFAAALLLAATSATRLTPRLGLGVLAIALFGSASKETFAPALLLVAAAGCLAPTPESSAAGLPRRLAIILLPALAGVLIYALARFAVLPPGAGTLASAGNPFASATGWLFLPKLAAIASHALLSLRAANMQSLCWDALRDLRPAEWISAALFAAAVVGLWVMRDRRALWLTLAAFANLAPTVMVVYAIWLGLDRYLYVPLILLLFAAAPYVSRGWAALNEISPRLAPLAAAALIVLAGLDTFVASGAYRDQPTWLATLVAERPEDPSVLVFVATQVGQPLARELLERLPPPPWPSAIIVPAIAVANANGLAALAQQLAEYGVREYAHNSLIVAVAMRQRYVAGKRQAALELLPLLSARAPICGEVRKQLQLWAARGDADERAELTRAADGLHCL